MSSSSHLLPLSQLAQQTDIHVDTLAALVNVQQAFDLPTEQLERIVAKFLREFDQGLRETADPAEQTPPSGNGQPAQSFMPMIPTYVQHVPTGQETGRYLALDLGGTNLRVCEVTLLGESKWKMRQQKFKVSAAMKTGEATGLFDYIASSVDSFLTKIGTELQESDKLNLGFTFSFPVQQTAIDAGTLLNWTKGFECSGAIGHDIVELLQSALDRKHIHVKVVSLVNDTAGTLMARAYESGECLCGGIFGTGTNGAYVERVDKITKMKQTSQQVKDGKESGLEYMIVNTEWGAFDNDREVLPFTFYDNRVDRISINPRKQAYEKMISGMYLGEISRNVILHLVDLQVLFKGHSTPTLNGHYGLDTAIMSALEECTLPNSAAAQDPAGSVRKALVESLGLSSALVSDSDCLAVARISEIVSTRGCRLSACAMAAVVRQVGDGGDANKTWSFGLDGSLIEHLPRFEARIREALVEILGPKDEARVLIGLAKDGSGVGAALCAAAAIKQREAGL